MLKLFGKLYRLFESSVGGRIIGLMLMTAASFITNNVSKMLFTPVRDTAIALFTLGA